MYDPPKFLTPEVLAAVLAEFSWPAPYTLKADFDGIEVRLPRCHLDVTEGFESDMNLAFRRTCDNLSSEWHRRACSPACSPMPTPHLGQRLDHWFDFKTATFGGEDAVETVRHLVGNVARFDFGEVGNQPPEVNLPDLVPFFKAILAVLGRRPTQVDDARLSFKTPPSWMDDFTITDRYELLFSREARPREGEDVAGVGLRVVDRAIRSAVDLSDALGVVGELGAVLVVFAVRDRITGNDGPVRTVIVGATPAIDGAWKLLRDWELIKMLSPLADKRGARHSQLRRGQRPKPLRMFCEPSSMSNHTSASST